MVGRTKRDTSRTRILPPFLLDFQWLLSLKVYKPQVTSIAAGRFNLFSGIPFRSCSSRSRPNSRMSTTGDTFPAGSCYVHFIKNPELLPSKWAKTSVVNDFQRLHNPRVEIPNNPTKLKLMHCEQRANYVLDPHLPLTESMFHRPQALFERRFKPRSTGALPARVWGVDSNDDPFSFDCLLDNISASGLYLRLPRRMKFSAVLSLVVRLTHGPFQGMSAAIKGTVIRQGRELDGHTGIAIRIVEHRFI